MYTTDKGARARAGARRRASASDVVAARPGPGLAARSSTTSHDVRGVRRLMVEGGGRVHTQLLQQGLADELQLVLAPLFVGEPDAPRLFGPGRVPGPEPAAAGGDPAGSGTSSSCGTSPPPPASGRPPPPPTGTGWRWPANWPPQCPPSQTAFSVGAVVVAADGTELARGYSREGGDPVSHAEEAALAKLDPADPRLADRHGLQQPGTVRPPRLPPRTLRPAHPRRGRPPGGHGLA